MTYTSDTIKKLQDVQLEIYKDFEKICRELDLPMFVIGGSAIGAFRHDGFIPWDDDIDVCMVREDYNKLMKALEEHPHEKYELIAAENQDGYVLSFGKFSKKGTEFIEGAHSYRKYIPGIAIDIFPYDATVADEKARKKQIKKSWFWNRIMVLAEYPTPTLPSNMNPAIRVSALAACRMIHWGLRLVGITRAKAYKNYLKYAGMYNGKTDAYFADFSHPNPESVRVEKDVIFPVREIKFGDTTIQVMNQVEVHLTGEYGDYMQLPPEEKRLNHPPKYVNFGDGEIIGEK